MIINWPIMILCGFSIAILLTVIFIPQIIKVSFTKRLFDKPEKRKIHKGVIPRLGGLSFLPSIIVGLGILLAFILSDGAYASDSVMIYAELPSVLVLISAMTLLFFVGLIDDLVGLRYMHKLCAQALGAAIIVTSGMIILNYHGLVGIGTVNSGVGAVITFFMILYIINSMNMIDGIDGLASGLSIICLAIYGIELYAERCYLLSAVSFMGVGSLIIFFFYNVFGSVKRHTKIFMGDIGSLTLGILLAFLATAMTLSGDADPALGRDAFIMALSPLVIPMFDLLIVFIERISGGKSPFLPDKRHIHHRLLAKGFGSKAVLTILLLTQIAIVIANYYVSLYADINVILVMDLLIYLIIKLLTLKGRATVTA